MIDPKPRYSIDATEPIYVYTDAKVTQVLHITYTIITDCVEVLPIITIIHHQWPAQTLSKPIRPATTYQSCAGRMVYSVVVVVSDRSYLISYDGISTSLIPNDKTEYAGMLPDSVVP